MKLFKVTKTIKVFLEAENSDAAIDAFATYALDDAEVDTEEITEEGDNGEFCVDNVDDEITVQEWFEQKS